MKKILIVDDSLLDRKLLMSMLQKANILNEILQAVDGEDGLEVLSNHYRDICLILLDWQMPKLNGIDFMRGVVRVPEVSRIPIVMITASGADENKNLAREVNPYLAGYLVKPYKAETLIKIIEPFVKE